MLNIWDFDEMVTRGACVFCRHAGRKASAQRRDGLTLHECAGCGLAYLDPRPSASQISAYYSSDYFTGGKDFFQGKDYCAARDEAISGAGVTGYQALVANFTLADKTILDIGCASGALLHSLKPHKPKELIGLDVAEYPLDYGRRKYGLDLRRGFLETADLPDAYFDIVSLIDLIEHVEDLPAFMAALRRALKDGGEVLVATPNFASFALARDNWKGLAQDFEHLHYFSPQSLRTVAEKSGFNLVRWWAEGTPFQVLQYPRLRPFGLHRARHPGVSLRNLWFRARRDYHFRRDQSCGYELWAVLSAA
jgi:2-polyprenyl-3-methyl-5-hydroxy-6-metoxy-1,4-benzoquinol methylase